MSCPDPLNTSTRSVQLVDVARVPVFWSFHVTVFALLLTRASYGDPNEIWEAP